MLYLLHVGHALSPPSPYLLPLPIFAFVLYVCMLWTVYFVDIILVWFGHDSSFYPTFLYGLVWTQVYA